MDSYAAFDRPSVSIGKAAQQMSGRQCANRRCAALNEDPCNFAECFRSFESHHDLGECLGHPVLLLR
jgi:hypothetical protein